MILATPLYGTIAWMRFLCCYGQEFRQPKRHWSAQDTIYLRILRSSVVLRLRTTKPKNSRVRPLHERLGRIFSVASCVTEEEWLPICRAFLDPIFSIAEIYEDTLPALDAHLADGCRIGILSNCPWGAPSEPWFEELGRHGLLTRCEVAIFCSDVGWRKPAPTYVSPRIGSFRMQTRGVLVRR